MRRNVVAARKNDLDVFFVVLVRLDISFLDALLEEPEVLARRGYDVQLLVVVDREHYFPLDLDLLDFGQLVAVEDPQERVLLARGGKYIVPQLAQDLNVQFLLAELVEGVGELRVLDVVDVDQVTGVDADYELAAVCDDELLDACVVDLDLGLVLLDDVVVVELRRNRDVLVAQRQPGVSTQVVVRILDFLLFGCVIHLLLLLDDFLRVEETRAVLVIIILLSLLRVLLLGRLLGALLSQIRLR